MNEFEIELPADDELSEFVTDDSLYSYDFSSFSLVSLQKVASKTLTNGIRESLLSNTTNANLATSLAKNEATEYVAKFSDLAQEKIKKGEWILSIKKKTGETGAIIRDTTTGKIKEQVTLDKKTVQNLGNLPELSAIQSQLASISEGIEDLNQIIQRVEQGQYNDRFAGFFSARQLIIEGLASKDEYIQKSLLVSAIQTNNETIAKLALSIHQDGLALADPKTKAKDAKRIDNFVQSALGYLNSSVQLNLVAYTTLHEERALFSALANYRSYIVQDLLKENEDGKTIAWLLDNGHSGGTGKIESLTREVSTKINSLVENYHIKDIEGIEYEQKQNK